MSNRKLKVNEHHNKENHGLAANRPCKPSDNFNLLRKSPLPVEDFEASDLSSIISQRQLKSRQIFEGALSKKSSLRQLVDDSSSIQSEIYKQIKKRVSVESVQNQPQKKVAGLALKSMLSEKNNYSQLEMLKETNYKLIQENKQLKVQLRELKEKIETSLTRENTYESRPQNGSSFDSFEKLEESNKILRSKLDLSKRNQKQIVEKYEKQIKELSKDKRSNFSQSIDKSSIFSVSSIYSKAFNKAQMPQIDSFAKALKNYFQQFQDTFLKINIMFQNLQQPQSTSDKYLQSKQLVSLLKIPVMYKNKPKVVDSLLSVNRSGYRNSSISNKSITQTFSPELLSSEQTLYMLQQMLSKVLKSNNMLRLCKEDKQLMSLIARLRA